MTPRTLEKDRAAVLLGWDEAKPAGLCGVPECKAKRARWRAVCSRHSSQVWRATYPVTAQFHRLRGAAKRRGIRFELTLTQWKEWCVATGYVQNRVGGRKDVLSVDRIDPKKPYRIDNIQALTVSDNARKAEADRRKTRIVRGRVITCAAYEPVTSDPLDRI